MDSRTRRLALVALLSSLYVVANAIPIDAFIGGAGFITAGIILLPPLGRLFRPKKSGFIGPFPPLWFFLFPRFLCPGFWFFRLLVSSSALRLWVLGDNPSYSLPL